jgi:hypothetical protein
LADGDCIRMRVVLVAPEVIMRSAGNFHPQWGYLAPAPSFLRGARIVLVATAVGATAGAAVVVSLLERPGADADNSIAAHALVTSAPVSTAGSIRAPTAAAPADAAVPQTVQSLSASPKATSDAASPNSVAPGGSVASSAAAAQSHAGVAAAPSTTPATEPAQLAHAEAAATVESKPAVPAKRFAGKRHRTAGNEPFRRWQGERRRWRDNGFPPLFRLFSSRTGSSDYPN